MLFASAGPSLLGADIEDRSHRHLQSQEWLAERSKTWSRGIELAQSFRLRVGQSRAVSRFRIAQAPPGPPYPTMHPFDANFWHLH